MEIKLHLELPDGLARVIAACGGNDRSGRLTATYPRNFFSVIFPAPRGIIRLTKAQTANHLLSLSRY